jgi:hypothetical protein
LRRTYSSTKLAERAGTIKSLSAGFNFVGRGATVDHSARPNWNTSSFALPGTAEHLGIVERSAMSIVSLRLHDLIASSITVSVRRPRKSIFRRLIFRQRAVELGDDFIAVVRQR